MIQLLAGLVLAFITTSLTDCLVIHCRFGSENVTYHGLYHCYANFNLSDGIQEVVSVDGNHLGDKAHANVTSLIIYHIKALDFFPRSLEKFFPDIEYIDWYNGSLAHISADDLKPFPRLTVLAVTMHLITKLDGDLFKHTPNIVFINFNFNQIEDVGKGLFSGLDNLKAVCFLKNRCIDSEAQKREISIIKKELELKCLK